MANNLFMAWKGVETDQRIYFNQFKGSSWTAQQFVPGVATSVGPALANFDGSIYMAWKRMDGDQGIYWSRFNGSSFALHQVIAGVCTSEGPSLALGLNTRRVRHIGVAHTSEACVGDICRGRRAAFLNKSSTQVSLCVGHPQIAADAFIPFLTCEAASFSGYHLATAGPVRDHKPVGVDLAGPETAGIRTMTECFVEQAISRMRILSGTPERCVTRLLLQIGSVQQLGYAFIRNQETYSRRSFIDPGCF